jgi:hypothetical protein
MPTDVTDALVAPYDTPLTACTEVRPHLYSPDA